MQITFIVIKICDEFYIPVVKIEKRRVNFKKSFIPHCEATSCHTANKYFLIVAALKHVYFFRNKMVENLPLKLHFQNKTLKVTGLKRLQLQSYTLSIYIVNSSSYIEDWTRNIYNRSNEPYLS